MNVAIQSFQLREEQDHAKLFIGYTTINMSTSEIATSYAALILADEDLDVTVSLSDRSL